jgi:fumarate reductase subunit D
VPTITGLRSWGAVLVAVLLTAIGAAIDGSVNGELSWGFRIGFVLGVALAAVLVRRASIFTAMVQPPLVMVVLIFVALRLLASESMKITAIKVITAFPTMLTGTVVALLLCVLRIFAQPMRRPQEASKAQSVSVHV